MKIRLASFPAILLLFIVSFAAREADAATILVTTTQFRVGGGPGCSLQEAIYAANFETNLAISGLNPDGSDHVVVTSCFPGTGPVTIVLPQGAPFPMNQVVDDAHNPLGPTATPMIFSTVTIEANGSTLTWTGKGHARAFAVGSASVQLGNITFSGTGNLTIKNAYITGFSAKGGDGSVGGGGGLGAGGAIFVRGGTLIVDSSTFAGNNAIGGNGFPASESGCSGGGGGGGGGGLSGNGGLPCEGGGGGGGARGDGGSAAAGGGGGGGTVTAGANSSSSSPSGGAGGLICGASGGNFSNDGSNGANATCSGGGGGGGGWGDLPLPFDQQNGGNGTYGGGGGGGAQNTEGSNGGNGSFGGGGGGSGGDGKGGNGGFGGGAGGGGVCLAPLSNNFCPGQAGTFGGGGAQLGGGGAALGGAIFNDGGGVEVRNSTFYNNFVLRGSALQCPACTPDLVGDNGSDGGAAMFSLNGILTIKNSTISGNSATGSGGGVMVYQQDSTPTSFTLLNTIIYGNGANECSVLATSVTSAGIVGNLIGNNDPVNPCLISGLGSGVVSSSDPGLGPLQNNGGDTPTMAITSGLGAWANADAPTSLATDQRGFPRPSLDGHGVDIGAYELCTPTDPRTGFPCRIINTAVVAALTMQVSPAAGGTTSPAVGVTNYPLGSIATIQVMPNPGYSFVSWIGDVTDPTSASTTVIMNHDQVVTATFGSCGLTLNGRGTASSTYSPARVGLVWTGIANVDHYDVMRSQVSGGPYAKIGSAAATAHSFADTNGLVDGPTFYYTLNAVDGNGGLMCISNQKGILVP